MTKQNYNKIEKEYQSYEQDFSSMIPNEEVETLELIEKIINALHLGNPKYKDLPDEGKFLSWDGERLISAREKLSRYSEYLGEWITYHESRSDFAYIWRKGQYSSDWAPMKNKLKNATISDIESKLTEKYINEQMYSMFHRRRADHLIRLLDSVNRYIRTIDHRLWEFRRQQDLPQDNSL